MRHLLANIATYGIASVLVIGAALFAWMRTAQVALTTETAVLAQYEPDTTGQFRWQQLGERSYVSNCSACHRPDGGGWDQYPSIAHTLALAAAPGGREYVVDLHLYGLTSDRWRAPMPPMGHIQDAEMAAVINYVMTGLGTVEPADISLLYTPDDIVARRGQQLTPAQVNSRRPAGMAPVPGQAP